MFKRFADCLVGADSMENAPRERCLMGTQSQSRDILDVVAEVRGHLEAKLGVTGRRDEEDDAIGPRSRDDDLPLTSELCRQIRSNRLLVGRMPPQPSTFRAKVGAVAVRAVQRMLFWYTPQIQSFQRDVVRVLEEQAALLSTLSAKQKRLESALAGIDERLRQIENTGLPPRDLVQKIGTCKPGDPDT